MKIAFVSTYYHPAMVGGIEWYLYHVTRTLAKRGHEVSVLTTNGDGTGKNLPPRDEIDGVQVTRLPTPVDITYRLKIWPRLTRELTICGADIVHVFDYAQFHNLAVNLSRSSSSWASVVAVYDIHSDIPRARIRSRAMSLFDGFGAKAMLTGYDKILVRTPFQVEFTKRLGIPEEIIRIAPPGLDPLNFTDPTTAELTEAREKYASGKDLLLLYVGRLHPIKGIDVLIKATSRLSGHGVTARTVIVGPDQSGYLNYLRELAVKEGVDDEVLFTGYLGERDKWILQSICDVAVLPSSFEGFGQTLIQAMARGKPVIGTNVGGMPWVLEDGKAGIMVPYGDPEALADAIIELNSNEHLRDRICAAGRARAEEFSYPKLVDGLEAIYADIDVSSTR